MHHPLKFERRQQTLAPRPVFYQRLAANFLLALGMIGVSLTAGMAGYGYFEGLGPVDAFINAAMILSGMGPVDAMKSTGGKLFAGCYAIYSGVLIIAVAGVILAPVGHRMLHRFHAVDEDGKR
jgi:Co/Zn/Cd efflux system component